MNSNLTTLPVDLQTIVLLFCGGLTLFQSLARSCSYFKKLCHRKLSDRLAYQIANKEILNLDRIRNNADFEKFMKEEFEINKNESTLLEICSHKEIGFPRLLNFHPSNKFSGNFCFSWKVLFFSFLFFIYDVSNCVYCLMRLVLKNGM